MQNTSKRKDLLELAIFSIAFIIASLVAIYLLPKKGDVVVINCSISEISPDFTTEMREACRQARIKK